MATVVRTSPRPNAGSGRRLLVLTVCALLLAVPAAAARVICFAGACPQRPAATTIPFCPLPEGLRDLISAGYRSGRSPDVLAVSGSRPVVGGVGRGVVPAASWPSVRAVHLTRLPIILSGAGIAPGRRMPAGTGLDQVAPTIAQAIHLDRPHPSVRSGHAIPGIAGDGPKPRLVLEIAWKGISADDLGPVSSWPALTALKRRGSGTLSGISGSLPLDPAATLTTLGTGGLPWQHGITGTLLRNDRGQVERAWSRAAPQSVIATLAEDLEERTQQRALVGAIATDGSDRGIVGSGWYGARDRDPWLIESRPTAQVRQAKHLLAAGFGADATTDLLAVVMAGPLSAMDHELRRIVSLARKASRGRLLVAVVGTGSTRIPEGSVTAASVEDLVNGGDGLSLPLVEAAVPGGIFLDRSVMAKTGTTAQSAEEAMLRAKTAEGQRLLADAFQGYAVSFARYC